MFHLLDNGQYLRARLLDPDAGRFISTDPFSGDVYSPASLHKYLYAFNDPSNRCDPSGYFSFAELNIGEFFKNVLRQVKSTIERTQLKIYQWYYRVIIGSTVMKKILDHHSIWSVAQQIPYRLARGGREATEAFVRAKTYFPASWSDLQIQINVMRTYSEAIRAGLYNGNWDRMINGCTVTVNIVNGKLNSAWGSIVMTLDDFLQYLGL